MKMFKSVLILLVASHWPSTVACNGDVSLESGITSFDDNSVHDMDLEDGRNHDELHELNQEAQKIEDDTLSEHPETQHIEEPPKEKKFDIDRFLAELDEFDCDHKKPGSGAFDEADTEFDQLCAENLEASTFKPLGDFNIDQNGFFDYIRNNIYRPLAYNMQRKESLSGILDDLIFLDDSHSLIKGNVPEDTYGDFEDRILKYFQTAEGKTSDMEKNQGDISEILVQILKEFHIYWNSLRYKGQIDKVKVDTKEVMRNILREYQIKEKFLYEVTRTLADHIKEAYQRFITAHQSIKILNRKGASIIAEKMVQRYRSVIDAIKHSEFNYVKFVHEVALIIDMQQAYYIVNYKSRVNEPKSIKNFQTQVMEQIKKNYEFITAHIPKDDQTRHDIKDFTAALLLKMTHSEFLIFKYYGVSHIVNFSSARLQSLSQTTVKVYYELLNNLMMIPKNCVNFLTLKHCAFHETNRILRLIGSKYMLKRSTGGWAIYQYVHDMMKMLYSKSNDLVYSNWTIFKAYFYQNLFAIMYNFKKRYLINDMDCLEDLETLIGDTIDKFRTDNGTARINFGLIDELDEDLYYEFLDIKARFNHFTHIEKDPQILMQIQNELFVSFKKFEQKYNAEINQDFITLMDHVKHTIEEWRAASLRAPEVSIQVGELPLHAANLHPQIFVDVNAPSADQLDYSVSRNYKDINGGEVIKQKNQEMFEDFNEEHDKKEKALHDPNGEVADVTPAPKPDPKPELKKKETKEVATQAVEEVDEDEGENKDVAEQKPVSKHPGHVENEGNVDEDDRKKVRLERRLTTKNSQDTQEGQTIPDVTYDKINLNAIRDGVKTPKEDMTIKLLPSPKEQFEVVPQHFVESNHDPSVNDVTEESGITEFDID